MGDGGLLHADVGRQLGDRAGLAGTDGAGLGDLLPGLALHRELGLLRDCGLSPRQVLAAATVTAARAPGLDNELGSVQPGKAADLAVWSEDPLAAGFRPSGLSLVIAAGQCHDPAALLAGVAGDPAAGHA